MGILKIGNEKLFQQNLTKTKCSQPEINSRLILRSRLSERLNRALTHKLTIVSAPAGYGKTTAVNVWLKRNGIPSAWVSVDENDNDPVIFWKYIYAAMHSIFKENYPDASYAFSS